MIHFLSSISNLPLSVESFLYYAGTRIIPNLKKTFPMTSLFYVGTILSLCFISYPTFMNRSHILHCFFFSHSILPLTTLLLMNPCQGHGFCSHRPWPLSILKSLLQTFPLLDLVTPLSPLFILLVSCISVGWLFLLYLTSKGRWTLRHALCHSIFL